MFKILLKSLFLIITGFLFFIYPSFAQAIPGIPEAPASLEIISPGTVTSGQEFIVSVKITPQIDFHADVSFLLAANLEPIEQPGLILHLYQGKSADPNQSDSHFYSLGLWAGPLTANETKELSFRATAIEQGTYNLKCLIRPLADWGLKEEVFTIQVQ